MSKRGDLLSQVKVGDYVMYQDSVTGIYDVLSLEHPVHGDGCLHLKHVSFGHNYSEQRGFEYKKIDFNREFTSIYSNAGQRELSRFASLLLQAKASLDISKIHELLVKVDI